LDWLQQLEGSDAVNEVAGELAWGWKLPVDLQIGTISAPAPYASTFPAENHRFGATSAWGLHRYSH
jgi:hypothetical protein